ncbi:MAG: guanylate kinase, partial [Geovibrio sp.]|nr:guanylate kinase [Geovibrio sp.]
MLIVVSGPSGVGKGTVVSRLRQNRPEYELSVSLTTRPPRPHEVNGVDYWFVSRREFRERIDSAGMLEWAEFSGNLYGTPRAEVVHSLAAGKTVLLEIEVEGARQVKNAMPKALTVFIRPPSMFELAARLRNRGTESADEV